jgi:hypothetical protein
MTVHHHWIAVTGLPSQFFGYDRLTPVPKVEYRPYTHGEVKLLSDKSVASEVKYEITLDGIRTNFAKSELYFDDFQFILVLRLLSTVETNDFEVDFPDSDGASKRQAFNLRDVEFEDVRVKALPLKFQLSNGDFVRLTLPTLGHLAQLEQLGLGDDLIHKYVLPPDVAAMREFVAQLGEPDAQALEQVIYEYLMLDAVVHPKLSRTDPNEEQKEGRVVVAVDSVFPFRSAPRDLASRISFDA